MVHEIYKYENLLKKVVFEKLPQNKKYWTADIVQDALVKAIEKLPQFDERKGKLQTWLSTIASNLCTDFLRKKVNQEELLPPQEIHVFCQKNFQNSFEEDEKYPVRSLLSNLTQRDETVLRLKYLHNMTAREMSRVIDIPENQIPVVVKRALNKARKQVSNNSRWNSAA